jgi:hypothetical protein
MRCSWSYAVVAGVVGLALSGVPGLGPKIVPGAFAQQAASEGHPHKWQANDKSLYDLVADGFKLVTAVYDTSQTGPQTDSPDVHYFLQKNNILARCDFRKRGETSFYWCYQLGKPNAP